MVMELVATSPIVLDVAGARPLEALKRLREAMPEDEEQRRAWRQRARATAVMGSLPRSLDSFKSGERARPRCVVLCIMMLRRLAALVGICDNCTWKRKRGLPTLDRRRAGMEQHLSLPRHFWQLFELLEGGVPRRRL